MRPLVISLIPLLALAACSGSEDKEDTGSHTDHTDHSHGDDDDHHGDDDDDTHGDDDDDTHGDDDDDTTTGDDDDDTTGDDDDDDDTTAVVLDTYTCDPKLHGLTTTVLDTSASGVWVHYDLDTGAVVPDSDPTWDLRFSTWYVETNGGATGSAGVEVGFYPGYYAAFDDHCQAPSEGMAEDSTAGEGFAEWYDYDYATHELSAHDAIYYVKTSEGAYHRLIWDGYYEGKGGAVHTPGFRHGPVESPM